MAFNSTNMRFIKRSVVLDAVFFMVFFTSNVQAIESSYRAFAGSFRHHVSINCTRLDVEPDISLLTWPCNGAIISPKSVITSYKCLVGWDYYKSYENTSFRITAGCDFIFETCTFYDSSVTPKFTPDQAIALIQVTAPEKITFNIRIQPVQLPKQNNRLFSVDPNVAYHVTSYLEKYIGLLPYLTMEIVNMSECLQRIANKRILNTSICVRETDIINKGISNGSLCTDWGAPLVNLTDETLLGNFQGGNPKCPVPYLASATLIGIFDDTNAECKAGEPSLFFKVEYYVDWIKEQIRLQ